MKKLLLIGVILSLSHLLAPVNLNALTPGPEVMQCYEKKDTNATGKECQKILCEWENVTKNWPEDTGYHKDCDKEVAPSSSYDWSRNVILVVIAGGAVLLVRKYNKNKT